MGTVGEIASIFSMVALVVTAIIVTMQLADMKRKRNVEISLKLFEWGESERVQRAVRFITRRFQFKKEKYDEYRQQYEGKPEFEEYPQTVTSFFEHAGMLVSKKMVDMDVVVDHLGYQTIACWEKLEPLIRLWRRDHQNPSIGEHFEELYHITREYYRKTYKLRYPKPNEGTVIEFE